MSTDVQVSSKVEMSSEKQPKRRSKDSEKTHHRRSSNFQNKKYKHDHKFRKRSQSFNSSSGKFFPPYKMRKKDFIIPPTKFLLGGNITDPLNLNSLQDEEINRAMNAVTPKSSPLPTPQHRRGEIEVIIPPDITDPLNLAAGDDDATYEAMLTSPVKKTQKKPKKNKKKRNHRSSSGPGSGKEDSIEGAKLNQSDALPCKEEKADSSENSKKETANVVENVTSGKEQEQGPLQKRHKPETHGSNPRSTLRKMELKDRKADLDKIVSPVIPQPGAWNDRHRFRPPPQRTPQINSSQEVPTFKESDARFQYGNYSRYYGYRNFNHVSDVRLKVFERHKGLFRGKDVLDIGCNAGHLTLAIARDFSPNKVVGLDIDRQLIQAARKNIRHYVNCGKKDKFFPVSMPIVYGPINVPGVSEDKAFPHNISFIQGNYVLESEVQLSMEQPQFDVILCLSITKWIQLNWGDAGLKRAFKRMYTQLRPGGVLILEAQSWSSYKRKRKLTPEIWKNYHAIELFPHHFSQFLMSEIGFSRTEVIGSPVHPARGFQRPIKLFIKEDLSFDTPVYSTNTSVCDSVTPRYCRETPGVLHNFGSSGNYSYRLQDSVTFHDDCSSDVNSAFGTPNSVTSPESGFSESSRSRKYTQPIRFELLTGPEVAASSSQGQRESLMETASSSGESRSTLKYEMLEDEENTLDSSSQGDGVEGNETEVKVNSREVEESATTEIKQKYSTEKVLDETEVNRHVDNKNIKVDSGVKNEEVTEIEKPVPITETEIKQEIDEQEVTEIEKPIPITKTEIDEQGVTEIEKPIPITKTEIKQEIDEEEVTEIEKPVPITETEIKQEIDEQEVTEIEEPTPITKTEIKQEIDEQEVTEIEEPIPITKTEIKQEIDEQGVTEIEKPIPISKTEIKQEIDDQLTLIKSEVKVVESKIKESNDLELENPVNLKLTEFKEMNEQLTPDDKEKAVIEEMKGEDKTEETHSERQQHCDISEENHENSLSVLETTLSEEGPLPTDAAISADQNK